MNSYFRIQLILFMLLLADLANAQLTITVATPKISGQKAIVPLGISNGINQKVESVRATTFLLDANGKMIAQGTQWIIGGPKNKSALPEGGTNSFNFVLNAQQPIITSNVTAKVTLNRIVLEGGKIADPNKAARIISTPK